MTLEDGNIEQPFKPTEFAGKGDNTRPRLRDARVKPSTPAPPLPQ